jgi:hypothetical protein
MRQRPRQQTERRRCQRRDARPGRRCALEARVRRDPQQLVLLHDERLAALVIQDRPGGRRRSRLLFSSAARRRCLRLGHVLGATLDDLDEAATPVAEHRAVFDAHALEALDAFEQQLQRQRLDDHPRNDTDATAPVLVALDWLATFGIGAGGGFCRPRVLRWARAARRRAASLARVRFGRRVGALGLRRSRSRTGIWLPGQRKPQLVPHTCIRVPSYPLGRYSTCWFSAWSWSVTYCVLPRWSGW